MGSTFNGFRVYTVRPGRTYDNPLHFLRYVVPAPAPTEVQTSWEDAAEESVAVAGICATSTASTAKHPLPGNDSCHGGAPHHGSSDAKAGAAEAWAAAGPEDDAQAAQGEEEFDANMLW